MQAGDLQIVGKRVDANGLVAHVDDWPAPPRLIYAPLHQYPMGAVMSVARRLALISKARKHGTWIIEDDCDGEFRQSREPIAAMQGLVPGAPVIYIGIFSKTIFPSLRICFMVLPQSLLPPRPEGFARDAQGRPLARTAGHDLVH